MYDVVPALSANGRLARMFGGVMALLLLVLAGGFVARPGNAEARAQADDLPNTMTVIVGGLDTRTPEEPENTDVFMIARVNVDSGLVRVLPVPRDLFVDIPGIGGDKITRAYDYGSAPQNDDPQAGIELMKETVAYNFGIEVDAVVLTTFDGFEAIIDAVGGVDVENPYDVYDAEYPTRDLQTMEVFFPAGPLHLNGEDALIFCRTRHMDGDDGRVMRQQLVLRAVLDKVQEPGMLEQAPELVAAFQDAVRTDLSLDQMLAIADLIPDFSNDDVAFGSMLPYLWGSTAPNGAWIYAADWSVLPGFVQGYLDGTIS
jgi:LCP family protein required for cell wall assembly